MELGPEDASLLERRPHFRGCCMASVESEPEDTCMSLLERRLHFRDVSLYKKGVHLLFWSRQCTCQRLGLLEAHSEILT